MQEMRERELKFDVAAGWAVPDLTALLPAGGKVAVNTLSLHTTYFDTESRDLLRAHITLRRRTGDADEGWHLKVPTAVQDARDEIHESLDDGTEPPASLTVLVAGLTGDEPMRPIAILHTVRTVHRVLDASGAVLVEVADDLVDATALGRPATMTQWREIEVELVDGDTALFRQTARRLTKAGATESASRSKLARALGETEHARGVDSLHALVGEFLAEQCDAIIRAEVDQRRDLDVVHSTRVATRRFRSVLRVLAQEFDESRARSLEAELGWYAELLGGVRDCQVLRARLRSAVAALPPEAVLGPVAARIEESLATRERDARANLVRERNSERYRALLDDLREWAAQPPFVSPDRRGHDIADYVDTAQRKVNSRLKLAARSVDPEEALHRARKAGKRARYVAELAEPVLGKQARGLVRRLKALQDELGELQDSVVAADFLRLTGAQAGTTPGENGFTFGILWAQEQEAARIALRTAPRNLG
jgi:CHAD domain-containing protein